jgi:hypothetical protein
MSLSRVPAKPFAARILAAASSTRRRVCADLTGIRRLDCLARDDGAPDFSEPEFEGNARCCDLLRPCFAVGALLGMRS